MELDGPYYSMLNFFDNVGKLERIVNVSGLQVATTKKPTDAKAKHTYQYAPNESVVATCTATTFFSHDMAPAASVPAKPGQPAPVKKQGSHMKLTTGILFLGMVAGTAWGQNPDVIEQHAEHAEGSPAEEGDGLRCSLGGFSGERGESSHACQQPADGSQAAGASRRAASP